MAHQYRSTEPAGSPADADHLAIEQAVSAFFRALASEDHAALEAVVDGDFQAFDAGEQMDLPRLKALVGAAISDGRAFVWRVTDPACGLDGDLAWATWRNIGGVASEGVLSPMTWLESANLRRMPGGWRLTFLHSTRQQQAASIEAENP